MSRHVLNIIIVSNNGVSIDTSLIGFLEPLRKDSGIFFIEKKENSKKPAFFLCVLPETLEPFAFWKIFLDADFAPVAEAVFIPPKTLTANTLSGGIDVLGFFEPITWSARV